MLSAFIDDGQDEPGYIAPVDRLHPELRFRYRPLTVPERAGWLGGVSNLSQEETATKTCQILAERITSWELRDRGNQPVPINAGAVRKLRTALFDRLFNIVWGIAAPDRDPKATAELEVLQEAKFRSGTPGQ